MPELDLIISKEAIESVKLANTEINKLDDSVFKLLGSVKEFNTSFSGANASINNLKSAQEKATKIANEYNNVQKQHTKTTQSLTKEFDKLQIAGAKRAAAMDEENRAYKKLTSEVNTLLRKYQDLAASQGMNTKATREAKDEYDKLNKKLIDVNRSSGNFKDNVGNYKSAFDGIKSSIAAAFSIGAIIAFGRAAFKAFEEQEQANRRLMFAVGGNKQAYKELTEQATLLQAKTGVTEESIQQIQMLGVGAGRSTEEIKALTTASLALSSATGMELQAAYMQLSASLNGVAGKTLPKMGSEFANLTKEQLANGGAINILNSKYGDLAEKSATSTSLLKANWNELMETIGSGISEVASPALEFMNGLFSSAEGKKAKGLNFFGFKKAKTWAEIQKEAAAERDVKEGATSVKFKPSKEIEEKTKEVKKQRDAFQKLGDEVQVLEEKMRVMKLAGQQPDQGMINELMRKREQIKIITEDVKKLGDGFVRLAMYNQGKNVKVNLPATDARFAVSTKGTGQGSSLTAGQYNSSLFDTKGEATQFAIEGAQVLADTTFTILANADQAQLDLKLSNLEKEKEARLKNFKGTEAERAKIEAEYAKKEAKIKTESAKKQKAANIIQAIMNTALAIGNALATGGAAAPALAIMAGITGAAQMAIIAATKIPAFAGGSLSTPHDFIVGEAGPEWMKKQRGGWELVTAPMLELNSPGTQIISAKETRRMMELGQHPGAGVDPTEAIRHMEANIVSTIRGKREVHISASGRKVTEVEGNSTKSWANSKINWMN